MHEHLAQHLPSFLVTNVIVPIYHTAGNTASTAQAAAEATQELAMGIGGIESTSRSLRDQAAKLTAMVAKFVLTKDGQPKRAERLVPALTAIDFRIQGSGPKTSLSRRCSIGAASTLSAMR